MTLTPRAEAFRVALDVLCHEHGVHLAIDTNCHDGDSTLEIWDGYDGLPVLDDCTREAQLARCTEWLRGIIRGRNRTVHGFRIDHQYVWTAIERLHELRGTKSRETTAAAERRRGWVRATREGWTAACREYLNRFGVER